MRKHITKIHSKIHAASRHIAGRFHTHRTSPVVWATAAFLFVALFVVIGASTLGHRTERGIHMAELSFADLSPRGGAGGKALPASCESGIEHETGIYHTCPMWFWADSYFIPYDSNPANMRTTLRWDLNVAGPYVTGCSASAGPWSGAKGLPVGSEVTVNLTVATTYTLTCTFFSSLDGSPFTESQSLTIDVSPPPPATSCTWSGAVDWSPCSGSYAGTIQSDDPWVTVSNTAAGYTTNGTSNIVFSCNNGVWTEMSRSCIASAGVVNGQCSTTRDLCLNGTTPANTGGVSTDGKYYTWKCLGLGGGSTDSCQLPITPAPPRAFLQIF